MKKAICVILLAVILVVVLTGDFAAPGPAVTPTSEPTPASTEIPQGMKDALSRAQEMLDYGLSAANIYDILLSEGYTNSQANFALENLNVDWNEIAYNRAVYCHEVLNLNKEKLIEELKFERFTDEEIQYAIDKVFN